MYCVNRLGKYFENVKAYPKLLREEVLDLNHNGFTQRAIASELGTSWYFVQNVLDDYNKTGSASRVGKIYPNRQVMTKDVVDWIKIEKRMKPSIFTQELQNRLLLDGVVFPGMLPLESQSDANIQRRNEFLDIIRDLNAATIHCFDESSVIKTTHNRRYGNAPEGQPAYEVQRYASNATYTINLLHSPYGVDYVNIMEGPTNGQELLLYFEEALNATNPDGSVIMDNCGFHHGHFVEPILTRMLNDCGVSLVFQPPYSPEFNTCELCFHYIKSFLQRHQHLAEQATEYSILLGCEEISQAKSINFFKHCGYLFA